MPPQGAQDATHTHEGGTHKATTFVPEHVTPTHVVPPHTCRDVQAPADQEQDFEGLGAIRRRRLMAEVLSYTLNQGVGERVLCALPVRV